MIATSPSSIALRRGITLVEASAGTGKTYTLCRLILRLILEEGVRIERILAVTFTQAATAELQEKTRSLLLDCYRQLQGGEITETTLSDAIEKSGIDPQLAAQRLRYCIDHLDEACISTIHGFCKRSLDQLSMESGIPFGASIENVDSALVDQLFNEFLRIHFIEASPVLACCLEHENKLKASLRSAGKEAAAHPYADFEPKADPRALSTVDSRFQGIIEGWPRFREALPSLASFLKGNTKLGKLASNPATAAQLDQLVRRAYPLPRDLALLESFTCESFAKALNKAGADTPTPPFIDAADGFWKAVKSIRITVAPLYRDWLAAQLEEAKVRQNTLSFNDLLHTLNRALHSEQGDALSQQLQGAFDAALIDEFQDTDPAQYRIIKRLFDTGRHFLFFIGDPKQAIYRFRGADIFSYFEATSDPACQRYSLATNFRSTPRLVAAVNAVFANSSEGFAFDEIEFQPVSADARKPESQGASLEFLDTEPLFQNSSNKSDAERLLAKAAASSISQLIANGESAASIAVLVSKNYQADLLAESLRERGIEPVIKAERSIFQTPECEDLKRLLDAIARPSSTGLAKAALLTPLFGTSWQELAADPDETIVQNASRTFRDWNATWSDSSFDPQFQMRFVDAGLATRLFANPDGERVFTNYLHLCELLDEAQREGERSPSALKTWLERRRDEDPSSETRWQTRLCSDEGKLQIVTIHKSKGLQYPHVFLPFLSLLRPEDRGDAILYHKSGNAAGLRIHLSPEEDESAQSAAQREVLAEQIRLLYVALTRAESSCRILIAPEEVFSQKSTPPSAFAQMLLGVKDAAAALAGKALHAALLAKLRQISESSTNAVSIVEAVLSPVERRGETVAPPAISAARVFDSSVPIIALRPLSFSSISQGSLAPEDETERDSEPALETAEPEFSPEPAEPSLFSLFPKGRHTGDLFHDILETIDFQDSRAHSLAIEAVFDQRHYEKRPYLEHAKALVKTLLNTSLGAFALSDIPMRSRLSELEFTCSATPRAVDRIVDAFLEHRPSSIPDYWIDAMAERSRRMLGKAIRGFIDLVVERDGRFYILDWKSNYLGAQTSDYAPDRLPAAMAEHDYFLQYCLYAVALRRFLAQRLPGREFSEVFGGVYYLFIRGVEAGQDTGIYFDPLDAEFVAALDEAIGQPEENR